MSGDPYRTVPPKPVVINGMTLTIALDAVIGSLRIADNANIYRYSAQQREDCANDLARIFQKSNFTMTMGDIPKTTD